MSLNPTTEQATAITTVERALLVEAGAGTGKTWVLVQRFMYLLEKHPEWPIDSILAVTFTEKATREMRSRIRRAVENAALEAVPASIDEIISQTLHIPTIGIGAGPGCDGQVLVYHDLIGLFDRFKPKFVKQYTNVRHDILEAIITFAKDVDEGHFPAAEHTYPVARSQLESFQSVIEDIEANSS